MDEPAVLVLLEDDLMAQKLIATWPRMAQAYERAVDADKGEGFHPEDQTAAMEQVYEDWSSISGVPEDEIPRVLPMLFTNGFITTGGVVDEAVLKYIRAKILGKLPQPKVRREPRAS